MAAPTNLDAPQQLITPDTTTSKVVGDCVAQRLEHNQTPVTATYNHYTGDPQVCASATVQPVG